MAKDKKPKIKAPIAISKQPKFEADPHQQQNKLSPSWRIALLEMVDPFGWHTIQREKLDEIRDKLAEFEKLSWNEILVQQKHWHHTVQVEKINKDAQERLKEVNQDDIDELVSLHLSGKERIWGIRELGVLKLLWWDPEHQVCPSLKKHT